MPPSDTQDWDAASEAVDQTTLDTYDVPSTTPPNDQDEAKETNVAGKTTIASAEPAERPVKKMKRGKYISRACTYCQQRKIKVGSLCATISFPQL
ncbi:hypothetical protein RAB80_002254 [Fusarium oxysporum f. sp. vasinfectum]|nr:hypothetical protein RAB80_002254 [Fusarium oxysporum f. sp. vasinfectum]